MSRIKTVMDVVDYRMCVGCGACAYICPDKKIELVDFLSEGIRPSLKDTDCADCTLCVDVCPAVETRFPDGPKPHRSEDQALQQSWGPILEVWEGHAANTEIRFRSSSGGVLTALALYCIEKAGMSGVLHTGADPGAPLSNRTRLSQTRQEVVNAAGSRYAPASVCNGLSLVEQSPSPCAVVGQPSEIAAVAKACALRPELNKNVGLTMSFFCAGSPPTAATTSLLNKHGVQAPAVESLRYRGDGWPGHFAPIVAGQSAPPIKLTYRDSWAYLQAFRPWAVHLWPDGSGELADISCGDPWYKEPDGKNPGSSLIVVRTERGRSILRSAIADGYVDLKPAETWKINRSQDGLRKKKASIWGRHLAMALWGMPRTRFHNAHLFPCWKKLGFREKLSSVLGTLRRIQQRRLYRLNSLTHSASVPVKPAVHARELHPH